MTNRIELRGRVLEKPEIRVTPAGTETLRILVDCGNRAEPLILPIVMAGGSVRSIGQSFGEGDLVQAIGYLRKSRTLGTSRQAFEVIAEKIDRGSAE